MLLDFMTADVVLSEQLKAHDIECGMLGLHTDSRALDMIH